MSAGRIAAGPRAHRAECDAHHSWPLLLAPVVRRLIGRLEAYPEVAGLAAHGIFRAAQLQADDSSGLVLPSQLLELRGVAVRPAFPRVPCGLRHDGSLPEEDTTGGEGASGEAVRRPAGDNMITTATSSSMDLSTGRNGCATNARSTPGLPCRRREPAHRNSRASAPRRDSL